MSGKNYTPIQKDFVFDARCHECSQPLKSNVATILKDENGKEHPFGPACAENLVGSVNHSFLKQIPDFTKATLSQEAGAHSSKKCGNKNHSQRAFLSKADMALMRSITYLLLRQRKLSHIPKVSYEQFSDYANVYKDTGTLPQNAVAHINNLEKKQSGDKYGFNNLQAVYAYDCCIIRAITKITNVNGQEFLENIQDFLRRNLYLTQGQVQAVENWLQYIPQHRPLNSRGFIKQHHINILKTSSGK